MVQCILDNEDGLTHNTAAAALTLLNSSLPSLSHQSLCLRDRSLASPTGSHLLSPVSWNDPPWATGGGGGGGPGGDAGAAGRREAAALGRCRRLPCTSSETLHFFFFWPQKKPCS